MTTAHDRERLREVAAEYAAIATSEQMVARREVWRLSNRLEKRTVPFQIEDNGTFFQDLTPEAQCEEEFARAVEHRMLRDITNYRCIDDDRIITPYYPVNWAIGRPNICPELSLNRAPDATGRTLGYKTNTPLADLGNSLHKLRRGEFTVDREGTFRQVEVLTEVFGDILPIRIVTQQTLSAGTGLANKAVSFMGMDSFYLAMIDQPENVHRFFEFVATEASDFLDWLEAEQLITPNNGEFSVGSGSCGYTDGLPGALVAGRTGLLAKDCWGFQEAQEATGISPEMYAEFIHPYQRRLGDRYGLLYYGCCEPVHHFWPIIKGFHSLRKITVSPWCNQESIAASVGRDCVLSRKPHPMKLCGGTFSPADFEADLQLTLEVAKHNFVELIFRDTCTLCGAMKDRLGEACAIVHRLLGRGS